ncbi:Stf0 family sulfotransferase [Roseibium sp.]|uniref:Stf0 family sulfotransferase n=1 Tax=Roseibium sp. TaxID=1936156 RepID=UPI003A97BA30
MSTYSAYIICTAPRSGSTLLCKLLSATGQSGHPGSHFHATSLVEWLDYFSLARHSDEIEQETLRRVFEAARTKGRGTSGIYGLRLQRHSFDFFAQSLKALHPGAGSDKERLEATFGQTLFIHLTRSDKLAQAISFVKAEQTGLWHKASDGSELERLSPPQPPQYDYNRLKACRDQFRQYDQDWDKWFTAQSITPLRVGYDELSTDPSATLRAILTALDLDAGLADGIAPAVSKLANATNQQWAEKFEADNARPAD